MMKLTSRRPFLLVTLLLQVQLVSCGGGSGGGGSTGGSTSTPSAASLADEIAALERSGSLPLLDRTSSVLGSDSDGNGVRDDIDAFVARLSIADVKKRAILQRAKALQGSLAVDVSNRTELIRVAGEIMAAVNCVGDTLTFVERNEFDVERITMNTQERVTRYLRFNAALSGTSATLPRGNTCTP